jgi:hypothetical protein
MDGTLKIKGDQEIFSFKGSSNTKLGNKSNNTNKVDSERTARGLCTLFTELLIICSWTFDVSYTNRSLPSLSLSIDAILKIDSLPLSVKRCPVCFLHLLQVV